MKGGNYTVIKIIAVLVSAMHACLEIQHSKHKEETTI